MTRPATRVLAAILALLGVAVYARSLSVGFYSDDYQWLGRMAATLARPGFVFTVFYRDFNPVLHASFVLDYLAGGGSAWTYHLQSILLHGAVAALVFRLAVRLGGSPALAFAAVATWAAGARISEAVIWPAARGHELAALFSLAGILLADRDDAKRLAGAVAFFVAGLLAKESALFPMILTPWLVDRGPLRRRLIVVLGILAAAFVVFNVAIKPDFHMAGEGIWAALRKLPFVMLRPLGLGDRYGFTTAGFAVFSAIAAGVLWALWRTPARGGIVWAIVCALPVLPLQKVSSRYLYLPSIGYALAVAGTAGHPVWNRLSPAARRLVAGLVAACAAILVLSNALLAQREIDDYRILSEPYDRCVDALRPAAIGLAPGETLIVVETSTRSAIPTLVHRIEERGTITKLIPERTLGVGGLVELPDAINAVRGDRSQLAIAADEATTPGSRIVTWDGARARPVVAAPPGRRLAARLVPVDDYVRAARSAPN